MSKNLAAAALALATGATGANAATISFWDGGNFGARGTGIDGELMAPAGSNIAVQAISEQRPDGNVSKACVMSGFKDHAAVAYTGSEFDRMLENGVDPLDALEVLQGQEVLRSSYKIDAAYAVVADYVEGQDFVRINVGHPQQEDARIFLGNEEIPADAIEYEYSKRYGHPERPEESYTIRITDQDWVNRIKEAMETEQTLSVIPRSGLNDFITPITFTPNQNLEKGSMHCEKYIDEMNIVRGDIPSMNIGDAYSTDVNDVMSLALRLENEEAMSDPGNYQIATLLSTQGMFAPGQDVLQKMMNGDVIESSMGEYISLDHVTGTYAVSPDVMEFTENNYNSCSCTVYFPESPYGKRPPEFLFPPDTPRFNPPADGTPPWDTPDLPPTVVFPPSGDNPPHDTPSTPAAVPLGSSGGFLLAGLVGLGAARFRKGATAAVFAGATAMGASQIDDLQTQDGFSVDPASGISAPEA